MAMSKSETVHKLIEKAKTLWIKQEMRRHYKISDNMYPLSKILNTDLTNKEQTTSDWNLDNKIRDKISEKIHLTYLRQKNELNGLINEQYYSKKFFIFTNK